MNVLGLLRSALHPRRRESGASRGDRGVAARGQHCCSTAGCSRFGAAPRGSYELRFDHRGATETVYADRVVLALPFIALRALDYSGAGFDSAKINAIENLGYGYHTKLHLQFDRRAWMRATHPWPEPTTGQIWTTLRVQSSLDYSLGQRGGDGLIEVFTAASPAMLDTPPMPYARIADSDAVERHVRELLRTARSNLARRLARRGTVRRPSATRKPIRTFSPATRAGSSVSARRSRGTKPERRDACTSRASTRRSPIKASWKGGAESGVRAAGEILADYRIRPKLGAA